ncbi:MAG: glycosyltransferase [Planctomycetota bacterium]|nr:glycosyltransferase [Planctomycetota bacterium]
MLTYVIPTHDRPEQLALTLAALASTDQGPVRDLLGGAEVIIVDNASRFPATAPPTLRNGLPVRVIYRAVNEGAAGRNAAALSAAGRSSDPNHWLLMLDDDSAPLDGGFAEALASASEDVAAVAADIFLKPGGPRESGGLPEVFVGCGVAIRRNVFLSQGGYDPSFGYYAEEYDLAARFLLAGYRVVHDPRFRVQHRKSAEGRDMNRVLRNLVRNNACVVQRYAPERVCPGELTRIIDRYREIAVREHAMHGYEEGVADLYSIIERQPRREMSDELYDRFTGAAHCRASLREEFTSRGVTAVALVDPPGGAVPKHRDLVESIVRELGVSIVPAARAQALVIATLSPGPMLDAATALATGAAVPVLKPWNIEPAPRRSLATAA